MNVILPRMLSTQTTTDTSMPSPPPLQITYFAQSHFSPSSSRDVDSWELFASRRALRNLKCLISQPAMLSLLEPQIRQADAYYHSLLVASKGRYRECRTDLHVKGISMEEMVGTRKRWLHVPREQMARELLLPAHPEHYATAPYDSDEDGIVEVIGEHVARLRVKTTSDVPEWVMAYGDPAYPIKKPTVLELWNSGEVLSYIMHEFRNTKDGSDLILRLLLPEKAPEVFFREHAEHLAIEFRSAVTMAYQQLHPE